MKKEYILQDFVQCAKKYYKATNKYSLPRNVYRLHTKVPENLVRKLFGNFTNLKIEADKILNQKIRLNTEINSECDNKYGRYIISSIVEGAPINKNFFNAIKKYAELNNAKILLLWSRGVQNYHKFNESELKEYNDYLVTSYKFNNNLEAKDFLIHPAQILPLTGLERFGSKSTSIIVASTKQMLLSIPRPQNSTPHLVCSTGTISVPNYSKTRAGALAVQDNNLSALIVEIENDTKFFIRPIEWINNCFVDLGVKYTKDSAEKCECEAMIFGDLHLTEENETAVKMSIEQANYLKAKKIFIHDVISLNSISSFITNKYLGHVLIPTEYNTLEKELEYSRNKLNEIKNQLINSKLIIVKSNHDARLFDYCDKGLFLQDTQNTILGAECFIDFIKHINPIEKYFNMNDVTFLKKDESYKIKNIECGEHGHEGANGSKGNIMSYRQTHDKTFIGHSHSPKIIGDIWQVGTLSDLKLSYVKGASSWLHANGVIYENGGRQMIIWVNNTWKMEVK